MRAPRRGIAIGCVLTIAVFAARTATAQPFTLDEKIKPTELRLEPYKTGDARIDGRVYGAVITQTEPVKYFFIQGLSIFSPDYVGVTADDPAAPVNIRLHKETWDQANARGQTDSRGHWDTRFKTSGDFGIRVTADHLPARYALVVWTGGEVNAPMPSPFTRAGGSTSATRSSSNTLLYLVIAALAGALIAVVFMKSRSARSWVLIATLAGASLTARPVFAQGYDKAVAAMLSELKQFLQQQESVEKFWQSLKTLSQSETPPDEARRGPSLPSSCVDDAWALPSNPGCQCMTTAVDKLRKNRQMLEKLRILVANQKNSVDKAIALGNSYAQLHTLMGIQWVGIRKHDIEEPYAQFKQISNQKHQALMDAIQKDLQDVSTCEAKLGERDWYQKFGFMYFEFLYAAYRPAF
jgi:hypothetical protein